METYFKVTKISSIFGLEIYLIHLLRAYTGHSQCLDNMFSHYQIFQIKECFGKLRFIFKQFRFTLHVCMGKQSNIYKKQFPNEKVLSK